MTTRKKRVELPAFGAPAPLTLTDHAYVQLRGALMSGRFEPGQRLTIRGLATVFGISATPVREALRRLAAEGALQAVPNSLVRVPEASAARLRELRDIRVPLEGLATERAVPKLTEDEITRLGTLHQEIHRMRGTPDRKPILQRINEFHFTIYRAAQMPDLLGVIESLWLRSGPYINYIFPDYSTHEQGVLRGEILAAIRAGDARAARRALEQDVAQAATYLADLIESGSAASGMAGSQSSTNINRKT